MEKKQRKLINSRDLLFFLGRFGTIIILAIMVLCFSVLLPSFRTMGNFSNVLGQMAILTIFSIGMTCCLKMGDFDLSVGAIAAITGIVVAHMLVSGYNMFLAIFCSLATGVLVGMMNGFLVGYLGLQAFVCTLATLSIILGIGMSITGGMSIWNLPYGFAFFGRGNIWNIPNRFLVMIVLLVGIWYFHRFTPTGRRMEAIGGNPAAAKMSGINVDRNRFLGFVLSGFCSAIGGIILTSALMNANPMQGTDYMLQAFGACFIGAATVRIGQFHIGGTFIGVLIVVVAVNGLIILMVPGYLTDMIKGVILLLAIIMSGTTGKFIKRI